MTTPSIKGAIFARAAEDLLKRVSDGALSQAELARRLPKADVELMSGAILPSGWYDVQVYGRLLEVLKDVDGGGRIEYLRERGMRSADALMRGGVYQQMEYLQRTEVMQHTDREARFTAFGRDLRLLTSLHSSLLNFSKQSARVDPEMPDRYVIETTEAGPMPTNLCWTTDGFINRMSHQHGQGDLWSWTRPRPDYILYRMRRQP